MNSQKPRGHGVVLVLVVIALVAFVMATLPRKNKPDVAGYTHVAQAPNGMDKRTWFTSRLAELATLRPEVIAALEAEVCTQSTEVQLTLQVNFLEKSLQRGGPHFKELGDRELTDVRLSRVMELVDRVSTRLNLLHEKDPRDPSMQRHFAIPKHKSATRVFSVEKLGAAELPVNVRHERCNGEYVASEGDIYFSTAAHCIQGTVEQNNYFMLKDGTDSAVRYLPRSKWQEENVSLESVPQVDKNAMPESVSGKVVASYSWGVDWNDATRPFKIEKTHFSIAMSLPETARTLISPKNPAYLSNKMMMINAPEEAELIERDAQGRPTARFSSSSGSGITIGGGEQAIGTVADQVVLTDKCRKLCYAITTFTDPQSFYKVIAAERQSRLGGTGTPGRAR